MTSRDALRALVNDAPPDTLLNVPRKWLVELLEDSRGATPAPSATPAAVDHLLTVDEVAEALGTSRRWVYAHKSTLPFLRTLPGGAIRFSSKGLAAWMDRTR